MAYINSLEEEIHSVLESIFIDIEPGMDELTEASNRKAWSDSLNAACYLLDELKQILASDRLRRVYEQGNLQMVTELLAIGGHEEQLSRAPAYGKRIRVES
jgi:hypothetical protein